MLIRSVVCVALFSFTLLAFLVGCSNGPLTGDVEGTVVYDGKAIEKGTISFEPADGNGGTAGTSIENGKYLATKVPVGNLKVQIRMPVVSGKKQLYKSDKEEGQYRNTYSEGLPKKFNDESILKLEVQPGKNTKNWDLFAGPGL
jgi:hypothetical protein